MPDTEARKKRALSNVSIEAREEKAWEAKQSRRDGKGKDWNTGGRNPSQVGSADEG